MQAWPVQLHVELRLRQISENSIGNQNEFNDELKMAQKYLNDSQFAELILYLLGPWRAKREGGE